MNKKAQITCVFRGGDEFDASTRNECPHCAAWCLLRTARHKQNPTQDENRQGKHARQRRKRWRSVKMQKKSKGKQLGFVNCSWVARPTASVTAAEKPSSPLAKLQCAHGGRKTRVGDTKTMRSVFQKKDDALRASAMWPAMVERRTSSERNI
jgi:hypothetical protein